MKTRTILIVALLAAAVGVGSYFLFFNKQQQPTEEELVLPPDKPFMTLTDEQRQQLEQQKQEYLKTLEEFPEYYEIYIDLGNLERKLGYPGEAIKTFMKAHQANDKTYTPFLNVAVVYEENGYYDLAYKYYWEAQKIDPAIDLIYVKIADFYKWYYPQKQNEIEQVYLEGIEKAHSTDSLKKSLANYYFDNQKYQESLTLWEELAKKNLDDQSVQDKIKEVKVKLGI